MPKINNLDDFGHPEVGWLGYKTLAISGLILIYFRRVLLFAVVSSTPLYGVTCLHYPASSSAYFNTKGTQYYHGNRNSKVV